MSVGSNTPKPTSDIEKRLNEIERTLRDVDERVDEMPYEADTSELRDIADRFDRFMEDLERMLYDFKLDVRRIRRIGEKS